MIPFDFNYEGLFHKYWNKDSIHSMNSILSTVFLESMHDRCSTIIVLALLEIVTISVTSWFFIHAAISDVKDGTVHWKFGRVGTVGSKEKKLIVFSYDYIYPYIYTTCHWKKTVGLPTYQYVNNKEKAFEVLKMVFYIMWVMTLSKRTCQDDN